MSSPPPQPGEQAQPTQSWTPPPRAPVARTAITPPAAVACTASTPPVEPVRKAPVPKTANGPGNLINPVPFDEKTHCKFRWYTPEGKESSPESEESEGHGEAGRMMRDMRKESKENDKRLRASLLQPGQPSEANLGKRRAESIEKELVEKEAFNDNLQRAETCIAQGHPVQECEYYNDPKKENATQYIRRVICGNADCKKQALLVYDINTSS
ncbi:hypothetical protein BJ508DRAFT_335719 [Ascobolus immersus RN42]|uniref:Uncharacterized protein n=1 Tax=Ascobolus immersus RN42 TaxID=1160509 RepID=A0A3N4HFY2_ASCIM|nr:hypothetical protein BJ508DRAFT_335719 [Ascobolus immersus RN42]